MIDYNSLKLMQSIPPAPRVKAKKPHFMTGVSLKESAKEALQVVIKALKGVKAIHRQALIKLTKLEPGRMGRAIDVLVEQGLVEIIKLGGKQKSKGNSTIAYSWCGS